MRTFSTVRFSLTSQSAVRLCTNSVAAPGELDGRELLFIVFLKCRRNRAEEVGLIDGQLLDICGSLACAAVYGEVIWYLR